MEEKLKEFETLMTILLSPNEERKKAEEEYTKRYLETPVDCCLALSSMILSENSSVQELSLILLRQSITGSSAFPCALEEFEEQDLLSLKQQLLEHLVNNLTLKTKKRICDVLASLCQAIGMESMGNLMEFTFDLANSKEPINVQVAMYLLQQLTLSCAIEIRESHEQIAEMIVTLFSLYESNEIVQISVLKSLTYYLLILTDEEQEKVTSLSDLIPDIITLVTKLIQNKQIDLAKDCLQELIETANYAPLFFKAQILPTLKFMFQISREENVERLYKELSMEFLIVITEHATGVIMSLEGILQELIELSFEYLVQIDENETSENWEDDEDPFDAIYEIGDYALRRISIVTGGEELLPISFEIIGNFLGSNDFKKRFAAVRAISSVSASTQEMFESKIEEIVEILLNSLEDKNQRVRYQGCTTFSELFLALPELIQNEFSEPILQGFGKILQEEDLYVQIKICETLMNFCQNIDGSIITPYLSDLMGKLFEFLESEEIKLLEASLTTITTIASTVGQDFEEYYKKIMPFLINILKNTTESKYLTMRSKSIEGISIIGSTVPKDVFYEDSIEIMEILINVMKREIEKIDESQRTYIFMCLFRICSILGKSFVKFLDSVMPFIIKSATIIVEYVEIDETEEEFDVDDPNNEGLDVVKNGYTKEKVIVKTATLEEKSEALGLIFQFALKLEELFYPYAKECIEIVLPLIDYPLDASIRNYAALATSRLFNVFVMVYEKQNENEKIVTLEQIQKIFKHALDFFHESILKEKITEILITQIQSIGEIISFAKNHIESSMLNIYLEDLQVLIEKSMKRKSKLLNKEKNVNTYNYEKMNINEELIENENDLNFILIESCSFIIKYHTKLYLEFFQSNLYDFYSEIIKSKYSSAENRMSIAIFGDIFEFSNDLDIFQFYWEKVNSNIVEILSSKDSQLRKAAAYVIGVCAEKGSKHFAVHSEQIIEILYNSITSFAGNENEKEKGNQEEEIDEDALSSNDSLISTFGKILFHHKDSLKNFDQFIPVWLQFLPITTEIEEVSPVVDILCKFVEDNNQIVIGQNFENIPIIFSMFTIALMEGCADEELSQRMFRIIKYFDKELGNKQFKLLINSMEPEELSKGFLEIISQI
ncbi:karyopherin (importin) beta 3 [Anaeramoeba flamelloides]|uniref:Karyopherin (Importin) beta 3 n=1 Tax=Anaeramoeba flamelloides TaxID=1746091 RepID=A0ABQ8XAP4_9EUKA|nr:karyopherin (importin) beta 3 [Anaeramoeba flamelloides]